LQAEDPLAQASDAEQSLLSALSLLPLPLTFHRLTNASSNDLFGSVSIGDVVAAAKEFGVRIEETQGAFEEKDGVEKGRVKSLGEFTCEFSFGVIEHEGRELTVVCCSQLRSS
jgi:ribosomal protein L9